MCLYRNVYLSHVVIACCAGTIPAAYGTSGCLPKLATLQLSGNLLNGTIPERSAARKHLAWLAVAKAVKNIMCMCLLLVRQQDEFGFLPSTILQHTRANCPAVSAQNCCSPGQYIITNLQPCSLEPQGIHVGVRSATIGAYPIAMQSVSGPEV